MIMTFLNWTYITFIITALGLMFTQCMSKALKDEIKSIDMVFISGIILSTIYAEAISLIGGVGTKANVSLIIIAGICCFFVRGRLVEIGKSVRQAFLENKKKTFCFLSISFLLLFLFLIIGNQYAHHADTDGYHAQAIRWIEDYGVVKGLGNLHNRLAYNSSFMCLQALFSWSWLIGQSMHTMNSYLGLLVVLCIIGKMIFIKRGKLQGSDFLLALMLFYTCSPSNIQAISSPHSDMLALLLVIFVIYKWCVFHEQSIGKASDYAFLCVIGLFAISVKLSTGMLLLLAIQPFIMFCKEKKCKQMLFWIICGLVVISPFLIRNVILSGYLIYPYSSINLFDFDWKMLPYAVDYDRNEIMVWGKGLCDISKSNWSFSRWFPNWWQQQSLFIKAMVGVNILCLPIALVAMIKEIFRRRWENALIYFEGIVLLLFWMFTAPLARYGVVFLLLTPCIVLGYGIKNNIQLNEKRTYLIILVCLLLLCSQYGTIEKISLKRSAYYMYRECTTEDWCGMNVYIPIENGYAGYYYIPSTPYRERLQYIELRGADILDGIRVKEEWKNTKINPYGYIDD